MQPPKYLTPYIRKCVTKLVPLLAVSACGSPAATAEQAALSPSLARSPFLTCGP